MNSKPTEMSYFDKLKRLLKDVCVQIFEKDKFEFLTFHISFTAKNFKITTTVFLNFHFQILSPKYK